MATNVRAKATTRPGATQSTTARRVPVRKENGDAWTACYDRRGRLVGICPPDAITPVADSAPTPTAKTAHQSPNMTVPSLSEDVLRQAGAQPAMGTRQATPKPPAGVPVTDQTEADEASLRRRMAEVRKGLYGGGTAQEAADLAVQLNQAAITGLRLIHAQGPRPR